MSSTSSSGSRRPSRREFLRRSPSALAGLTAAGPLLLPFGCRQRSNDPPGSSNPDSAGSETTSQSLNGPVREHTLTAGPIETEVGPGRTWNTWGYNGQYPGPELRVTEGERLRVTVENQLPDAGTTVHWHGLPVPNGMDGVPGVTQAPIPPGESMTYEYEAAPAGTYMYHSHRGLQLDRGLVGPLIVEERTPHVDYDREHLVILDDFLSGAPKPLNELAERQGGGGGCMMGNDRRGMMDGRGQGGGMMSGMGGIIPPYEGLLMNGQMPGDPSVFEMKQGERVRFRLINLSSATTYDLALSGHRMLVSHTDGRPVEPVEVDSLRIGMGERYDVIVEANNPGAHALVAEAVEGDVPPARAVVRYPSVRRTRPPEGQVPEGLQGGRRLRYGDLQSVETPLGPGEEPDRTMNLRLSGGMMMSRGEWSIDGQHYPDADPLEIRQGERVRVNMQNRSMMLHPMHLHGHFFQVGNALKDTVITEAHMGQASFEFEADNPGDWFFHCHNLYHLEAGMARVFEYA
ncbi:multicopper oxidase family protein [Salinibacter sp.]|uniref:multicopper oxidase family protein n=1 Tax=Salinibacter sp. TaxID=2065818 RepID=UPI003D6E36FB